ncbi:pIIIa [Deer atadenovirus A]|uniref:PIIIa n=1 Tax=Deer atadenovirus A TaxID=2169706 RepID=A0A515MFR3_9ADEN|nr:pIIIa [Deer atadenovirus A]
MDQSVNSSRSKWTSRIIDSIISDKSKNALLSFQKQPIANKLIALENAVVPNRKNETPQMIADLLNELVKIGAIKLEEAGPMYSDLLIRVHKYNSMNVQNNLETLVNDIRSIQSDIIRTTDIKSLSNQTVLNSFLNSIPQTVDMGQYNYEAFKQTLRLFINETPNVTVFKSGFDTFVQVNITGVNTINLNDAFKNLSHLWGVVIQGETLPGNITSRLTANTRVLLYFMAPFTNDNTFSPDTFISTLMKLYRLTVSTALEFPEETETEIVETAKELGTDGLDLTRTLAYLIKNKEDQITNPRSLSPRQLQILRYIQNSLTDRIDRNNETPQEALEQLSFSFAPSFYEQNGPFIRRLIAYMEVALYNSPSYFREIYSNKFWTPPASFWTQNYTDFFTENQERLENAVSFRPEELPIHDISERGAEARDEDFATAVSPSTAISSVQTKAHTDYSSVPVSAFYPLRERIRESISKAVIPPLTGYVGRQVGETILPGSGEILAPAASLVAAQMLDSRFKHRRERLKDAAKKRYKSIRENRNFDSKSDVSEDISINPLLGTGSETKVTTYFKSFNKFSHLQPKRGNSLI